MYNMISKFSTSGLNVIDRPIVSKIVHLNTKFRDNYYNSSSTDFLYKFPFDIKKAISVRVRSIDIPNTSYTFCSQKGNNMFMIEPMPQCFNYRLNPHERHKITIPDGNYSAYTLMEYLNKTYFYQKKDNKKDELRYIRFYIHNDRLKSEFQLTHDVPEDYKYNIIFLPNNSQSLVNTMGWLLGFRTAQYLNVSRTLVSEGLFDAAGDRYIYFSLDDFNKNRNDNNIVFLDNSFIDRDILGKIYLKDGKFHVNVSDDDKETNLKKREFNGPVDFERIHMKLLDEYGNVIYLNNMDFSFSLEFKILYERRIPGKLNEIDRPVISKIVHLNTKFRDNYYNSSSSDFFYKFPLEIKKAISVRVHSIDIPNTSYTFCSQKGNNTFMITPIQKQIDINTDKNRMPRFLPLECYKITIPDGNYSAHSLMKYLNKTYFYQKKNNENDYLRYIKFYIDHKRLQSEFQLTDDAPDDYKYNIIFISNTLQSIVNTMGWLLGFRMGQYLNVSNTLISEGLFDGGGERYIYFSLDDFNTCRNTNNLIALDKNFIDKNILGKIYLNDGNFHVNITDNDSKHYLKKRTFNGPVNFDRIQIKLYDEYGNITHLNHMDYSVALEFEILYENWCY